MVNVGRHAIVAGAGIAGLAAAGALAGRFARVTVLDRDELPGLDAPAAPRRGVPQGGHAHVLLIAGQRALDSLFPDLLDELTGDGAVRLDPWLELSFHRWGRLWPRMAGDLRVVTFSRPLLERALRRRVAASDNVEIRDRAAAAGLSGTDGRVTGVHLDDGTRLDSDLVVDATGRGSRSDRWLAALGCPAPPVTEVGVGVGYATRLYRRKPGDLPDARAVFVLPAPPREHRCGVALPIEDDRWMISLGGWHGAFPRDADAFERHARDLPYPGIANLVDGCEPLSELAVCAFPESRRRHFEKLRRMPAGYLALGDAVCSVNPIYGQGMACAALQAVELGRLLDRHGAVTAALSRDFHRAAAGIVAVPWQFATGGDFAYPQTRGRRPAGVRLLNAYARQVQLASTVDPDIRLIFNSVQHLVMDPAVLRRPATVVRVLRAARHDVRVAGGL